MVTHQAQTDESLPPFGEELPAGGGVFHLPPVLASAYGPTARYDLRTPLGLIEYTIAFVNRPGRKITVEEVRAGVQLPVGRERLYELLRAAVRDDGALANPSDAALAALRKCEAEIRWVRRIERTPEGVRRRHHAFVLGADGFYALVATLLASEVPRDKRGRSRIRQCEHCQDFFISRTRAQHQGRPEWKYCDSDTKTCREDAHKKGGLARQHARRARQRAQKLLIEGGVAPSKARATIKQAFADHRDATADQLASYAKALLQSVRKHK